MMNMYFKNKFRNIRINNVFLIMTIAFFLTGIILGVNSVAYTKGNTSDLNSYFKELFTFVSSRDISYKEVLLSSILSNLTIFMIIFILGNWALGSPFVFLIMLFKGYMIGYTFTVFIQMFSVKGLCVSLVGIVPQNLIYLPCFIVLATIASSYSYDKLKNKFQKINKTEFINEYVNASLSIAVPIVVAIIFETFLLPNILKMVILKLNI